MKPFTDKDLIEALHRALVLAKSDVENHGRIPLYRYGSQSTVVKALEMYERWKVQSGRVHLQKP
jgi:hypothetical protein